MPNVVNLSIVQLGKRSNLDGGKRQMNFVFELEHFDTDECERINDLNEFFEEITDDIYQQTKKDKNEEISKNIIKFHYSNQIFSLSHLLSNSKRSLQSRLFSLQSQCFITNINRCFSLFIT